MSQIEHNFRQLLSKKPELEKCHRAGLINRRALARYLIKEGIAPGNQMEAIVAMLRRFPFREFAPEIKDIFKKTKITIKDNILIFDFAKEKELVRQLQKIVSAVNYDRGDTLKLVIGTTAVKVFADRENEKLIKEYFSNFKLRHKIEHISEVSILFPDEAITMKGIISTVTQELALDDIIITEMVTATPELILYVKEEFVLKVYELLKRLQK